MSGIPTVRGNPSDVARLPQVQAPAAMSVDVEDWFQVENLRDSVHRSSWPSRELRVERNTERILEMLAAANVRATFFVLGWVAGRVPNLVRAVADAGHEIASHGYGHDLVYSLTPAAFREDVERSVRTLEDACGQKVRGYRAPSFSITEWALDVLQEAGLEYDSSAFPAAAHDRYGRLDGVSHRWPLAELRPGFTEVSVSCLDVAGRAVPWGGGGYFRLLPYPVFRSGVKRILGAGVPYVFYIHPWEIDPGQPRVTGLRWQHSLRHYSRLKSCDSRLAQLLSDFKWGSISDLLATDKVVR